MLAGVRVGQVAQHCGVNQQIVKHVHGIRGRTLINSRIVELPCQTRENDRSLAHRVFDKRGVAPVVLQNGVITLGKRACVKRSVAAIRSDQQFVRQRPVVCQHTRHDHVRAVQNIIVLRINIDFLNAAREQIGNVTASPAVVASAVNQYAARLGIFGQQFVCPCKATVGCGGLVIGNVDDIVNAQVNRFQTRCGCKIPTREIPCLAQRKQQIRGIVVAPRQIVLNQQDVRIRSCGNHFGITVAALGAGVGDLAVLGLRSLLRHLRLVCVGSRNRLAVCVSAHRARVNRRAVLGAGCRLHRQHIVMLGVRGDRIGLVAMRAGVSYDSVLGAGCRPGHFADIVVSACGNISDFFGISAGQAGAKTVSAVLAVGRFLILNFAPRMPDSGNLRFNRHLAANRAVLVAQTRFELGCFLVNNPLARGMTECRNGFHNLLAAFRADCFAQALMLAVGFNRHGERTRPVSERLNELILVGRAAERAGVERVAHFGAGRSNR